MKKTICTAALAAVISFGTVYAVPAYHDANTTQQDTVKKKVKVKDGKKKVKMKTDSGTVKKKIKMKKDSV